MKGKPAPPAPKPRRDLLVELSMACLGAGVVIPAVSWPEYDFIVPGAVLVAVGVVLNVIARRRASKQRREG